ncbi:MAG: flagellar biosynthetic protein FliO, partial [Actinomycetota bacterium]|nr:flagellar biosynthetic protein FliO [Actinomycetota bacterium]
MTDAGDVLRFLLSFGFVLALMWGAARVMRKQVGGRGTGALEVLARQPVGRGSSVAVVRVGDQALVVGVTEQRVSLLGEADPGLVESLRTETAVPLA